MLNWLVQHVDLVSSILNWSVQFLNWSVQNFQTGQFKILNWSPQHFELVNENMKLVAPKF